MRATLVAAFLSFAIIATTCTKKPTEPPNGLKDPRMYTWTVDTIAYPGSFQTLMRSIYATSPENVYIVGHNDQAFGKMFHFDGARWADVRLNVSQGGTISPPIGELSKMFGFGPHDIYAVGGRFGNPPISRDSSVIVHFDGTQWREQIVQPQRGRFLQSLWGASPTDMWAGGVNTLLRYDGIQWSHFPIEMPGQGIQFLSIAGLAANDVYMIGSRRDATGDNDTVAYLLYRYDGSAWALNDSSIQVLGMPAPKFGVILGSVSGTLYSVADGIFRRGNQGWERVHLGASSFVGIVGTSPQAIFAVGTRAQIVHFNGVDWHRYPEFPTSTVDFYSVWTNAEEVMVVGNDGLRTFVARGK